MALTDLTTHQFQVYDFEHLADWQGVEFWNADNAYFEERTRELDIAFQGAVESGELLRFVRTYTDISIEMLQRAKSLPLLVPLLQNALVRLINYYHFLRLRTRPFLCEHESVSSWQLEESLIAKARDVAAEMESHNVEVQDYDLGTDPAMKKWLTTNIQPILRNYVGSPVIWPWAHIRYADAARHGNEWEYIYRQHRYAYFHFDEVCYSLPFIIYLSDVSEASGPFSYVDQTDKMPQNLLLRSYHQALWHGCKITCHKESDRRTLASLPRVFRGGDLIGSIAGPQPFASHKIVPCTGPAGTAVLFEGFQLLHAGGHPASGSRKALFVAFRFPRNKLAQLVARTCGAIWRNRATRALVLSK